jgi:hypothetical protein
MESALDFRSESNITKSSQCQDSRSLRIKCIRSSGGPFLFTVRGFTLKHTSIANNGLVELEIILSD